MRSNGLFSISFFLWMALLSILSLVSMDDIDIQAPQIPYLDKMLHMGFYFVAMVLGSLFLWERFRRRRKSGPSLLWMALGLLIYGMIIEVLQGAGGNARTAELGDLAANAAGIGLAGLISSRIFKKANALNWPD